MNIFKKMEYKSPVKQKAKSRLEAYKKSPYDIIEHYNRERESQEGYCKRPLLELLQNIEDALNGNHSPGPHAYFLLKKNQLWIANKGKPFDRDGFGALCDSNRSPKYGENFIGNKGTGFKAVLNWTENPEIHSDSIHARFDRKEAQELIRQKIGSAYNSLKGKNGWNGQVPLLRVPIEASPDEITRKLLEDGWITVIKLPLISSKIKEVQRALQKLEPENILFLHRLDHIVIQINEYKIEIRKKKCSKPNKILLIRKEQQHETKIRAFFLIKRENLKIHPNKWKITGLCEVGIAFPYRKPNNGSQGRWMFNFFPICNAISPFNGILFHATFMLKPDRDDLNEAYRDFNLKVATELSKLLAESLPNLSGIHGPDSLLFLKDPKAGTNEQVQKVQEKLTEATKRSPFVQDLAGNLRSPQDLKLWKWDIGNLLKKYGFNPAINNGYLCHPDWQGGKKNNVLERLGAKKLKPLEHLELLKNLHPRSTEDAIKVLDVAVGVLKETTLWVEKKKVKNIIHGLSVFKTSQGTYRKLDDEKILFKTNPRNIPQQIPTWLEFDVLDDDFYQIIKRHTKDDSGWKDFEKELLSECLKEKDAKTFFEVCLLEILKEKDEEWWSHHGWEALNVFLSLKLEAQSENVLQDLLRDKTAKIFRVPTECGKWQPPQKVYAGETWYKDGEARWGKYLGKKDDRYILESRNKILDRLCLSPDRIDALRSAFRYLGISCMPKLKIKEYKSSQDVSSNLYPGWEKFYEKEVESCLAEASKDFTDAEKEKSKPKKINRWGVKSFYYFEGLETLREEHFPHEYILRLFKQLKETYEIHEKKCTFIGLGPGGGRYKTITKKSFPLWQLRATEIFWTPREAILSDGEWSCVRKMFLASGKGWKEWLPRLDLNSVKDETERDKLSLFAREDLGAKNKVKDASPEQWKKWLEIFKEKIGNSSYNSHVKLLRKFLTEMSSNIRKDEDWGIFNEGYFACWPCLTSSGIQFLRLEECFILDNSSWDVLKEPILNCRSALLLAELQPGCKIAESFGAEHRLLSKALKVSRSKDNLRYGSEDQKLEELFEETNMARLRALVSHITENKNTAKSIEKPKIFTVEKLRVIPQLEGKKLKEISLPYFWFPEGLWISCSESENKLTILAKAICRKYKLKNNLDDALENLWRKLDEGEENARFYLRNKGITDEMVDQFNGEEQQDDEPPIMPRSDINQKKGKPNEEISAKKHSGISKKSGRTSSIKNKSELSLTSFRATKSRTGSHADPKSGRKAERDILEALRNKLYDSDWQIEDVSHLHDMEKGECDILLKRGDEKILVEVKSIKDSEHGQIWLPVSETKTALNNRNTYWMVILIDGSSENFKNYWLHNPLKSLEPFTRKGKFIWHDGMEENIEKPSSYNWDIPPKPIKKGPDSFSYCIEITENDLVKMREVYSFEEFCSKIQKK